MTKEQIIENYKKARHITDGYVLDEDEMYFVEELVKAHTKLASNDESIAIISNRRDQLLDYHKYLVDELSLDIHEVWVDKYISLDDEPYADDDIIKGC